MRKEKILIVDDSEMNRMLLADILEGNYDIIEVADGVQAVDKLQQMNADIDLVLLDVVMPLMDGFGVLEAMNNNHWIDDIPVIMISAERQTSQIERAFELGVTDFIMRPFNSSIVKNRVVNTLLLYAKQRHLMAKVREQLAEKEKYSSTMIDILSHIVEARNGESGLHVIHVRAVTDFLLRKLRQRTDQYALTDETIMLISNASALHDIGKIAIDEKILNKPGKLTDTEFEIMRTHTVIGAKMLEGESLDQDDPIVKTAHDICRWHHERYDGRGYPDGLQGDNIPISAQVVALADVYDALTSVRVYKAPYDHDTAVQMILKGDCGIFHPLLMDCLREYSEDLRQKIESNVVEAMNRQEIRTLTDAVISKADSGLYERTLRLLDYEQVKSEFFSPLSEEIQFEYVLPSHLLTLSSPDAKSPSGKAITLDAYNDEEVQKVLGGIDWREITRRLRKTTPEDPELDFECMIDCDGESRWHRVIIRAVWTEDAPPRCDVALGRAIDIHETRMEMDALKQRAARDGLTGLLNFSSSKRRIEGLLAKAPEKDYLMLYFDLDYFKAINDNYGHQFGNEVLRHIADILGKGLRDTDISSRFGGDEFLLFMECKSAQEQVVRRIFTALCTPYQDYPISVSMGISRSSDVGANYEAMFQAADWALYFAKENGHGRYCFYDDSMRDTLLELPGQEDRKNKRTEKTS